MKKRLVAALLTAAMTASLLAGCGSSSGGSSSAKSESGSESAGEETSVDSSLPEDLQNLDMSEHVTLTFATEWITDNTDREMVVEKINEYIADKLNCEIEINVLDFRGNYTVSLESGEPIDLIWTATWYNVFNFAQQGAFLDVKPLVEEEFPNLLTTYYDQETWDSCAVGDAYYIIPGHNTESWTNCAQWGVVYREDLRKELGCDEITDWASMEAYAAAVKEAYPEMYPWHENSSGGLWHSMLEKEHIYTEFGGYTNTLALDLDTLEVVDYCDLDSVKEYAETERRWVENGYCQPDIASNTDDAVECFLQEKYAGSMEVLLSSYLSTYLPRVQAEHPDWEVNYINWGTMFGTTYMNAASMTSAAIPVNSANPERTLAFIELMLTDDYLFDLVAYGIEGTHYEVTEDGYYNSLQGSNITYAYGNTTASIFTNYDAVIPKESDALGMAYMEENITPTLVNNFWTSFPFSTEEYDDYASACSAVYDQYWRGVLNGVYEDTDAALAECQAKLKEAGGDYVRESLTAQWQAYVEEKGLKGLAEQ